MHRVAIDEHIELLQFWISLNSINFNVSEFLAIHQFGLSQRGFSVSEFVIKIFTWIPDHTYWVFFTMHICIVYLCVCAFNTHCSTVYIPAYRCKAFFFFLLFFASGFRQFYILFLLSGRIIEELSCFVGHKNTDRWKVFMGVMEGNGKVVYILLFSFSEKLITKFMSMTP